MRAGRRFAAGSISQLTDLVQVPQFRDCTMPIRRLAAIVTLLNGFWFIGQMRRFRPFIGSAGGPRDLPPNILSATPLEATKTCP